jgi:hypothetical protein
MAFLFAFWPKEKPLRKEWLFNILNFNYRLITF